MFSHWYKSPLDKFLTKKLFYVIEIDNQNKTKINVKKINQLGHKIEPAVEEGSTLSNTSFFNVCYLPAKMFLL